MAQPREMQPPYKEFVESLADVWPLWKKVNKADSFPVLRQTIGRLLQADAAYLQHQSPAGTTIAHALIWRIIPQNELVQTYAHVMFTMAVRLLPDFKPAHAITESRYIPESRAEVEGLMHSITENLVSMELPLSLRSQALAIAADNLCSHWVQERYAFYRIDDPRINQTRSLLSLMETDVFGTFCPAVEVLCDLARIPQHGSQPQKSVMAHESEDIHVRVKGRDQWKQTARLRLGSIRFGQIYEILHTENIRIKNQLLADILEVLKDPVGRAAADDGLQKSFRKHLLHAGSATVAILDEYMLLIKTLTEPLPSGKRVDESGVLLDRAAQSIRGYLAQREDAARIVINSLLNPQPGDEANPPVSRTDFSGRISMAMYYHDNPHMAVKPFEGQDLLDRNWTPQPIDALSSHRATMSKDPIGHITSIQRDDIFIEEFEQVMGERLLRSNQSQFHVEQRLLAMFRARFDDETGDKTKIQPSDVMLSDMLQSLKWNELIMHPENLLSESEPGERPQRSLEDMISDSPMRDALSQMDDAHRSMILGERSRRESALLSSFRTEETLLSGPEFQARILSHAYWHGLKEGTFQLPGIIQPFLESYAEEFERLSESRRLQWFPELGHVTVELELEDRAIREDVTPPQAAVIYAFGTSEGEPEAGRRSVQQLVASLNMDETLVRDCLAFWSLKMVIKETTTGSDAFVVLERLDARQAQSQTTEAATTQLEALESSHQMTQRDRLAEHADTYSAYIHGMLTNLGAMSGDRISETLESTAPGGFPFDYSDLVSLLDGLVGKDVLERGGAMWRIKSHEKEQ